MAYLIVYDNSGDQVSLIQSGKGGGEGIIYYNKNKKDECAKIYHPKKINSELHEKIVAMVYNPPEDPTWITKAHRSIAWPKSILYADRNKTKFMGFTMPLVNTKIFQESHLYYSSRDRLKRFLGSFTWQHHFAAAANAASAIASIHKKDHCIGDLRETNVLISMTSLVTLVDCDSFQIKDNKTGKIFYTRVGTGEYLPPELFGVDFKNKDYNRYYSDLFAMAVLIFKLLMNGFHPFSSKGKTVESIPTIEAKIKRGYFAYGGGLYGVDPPNDSYPFNILPQSLQKLFLNCFKDGHEKPENRPSAKEWLLCLRNEYSRLRKCKDNINHIYSPDLYSCPWCNISKLTGKDPFPEPIGDQINVEDPNRSLDTIDKRIDHIQSLIAMALAKGALTEEDENYLFDKAIKLQIPEKDIKSLIDKEKKGLAILLPGIPILELSDRNYKFDNIDLNSMPSSTLSVKNGGGGSLDATVRTDRSWLVVSHSKIYQKDLPLVITISIDTTKDNRCDLGFQDTGHIEISYKKSGSIEIVNIPVNLSIKTDEDAVRKLTNKSVVISSVMTSLAAIIAFGEKKYTGGEIFSLAVAAIFLISSFYQLVNRKFGLAILWISLAALFVLNASTILFLIILPIPATIIFSIGYIKKHPKDNNSAIAFPVVACGVFFLSALLLGVFRPTPVWIETKTGVTNPITNNQPPIKKSEPSIPINEEKNTVIEEKTEEDEINDIQDNPTLEKYLGFIDKYSSSLKKEELANLITSTDPNLPSQNNWKFIKRNDKGYWELNYREFIWLIWIPPGVLNIDYSEGLNDEERLSIQKKADIEIKGFWIGKYEVSVKQYKDYCVRNNLNYSNMSLLGDRDDEPIRNINWNEASEFCQWIGCRFPTELEWEMVARIEEDQDNLLMGSNLMQVIELGQSRAIEMNIKPIGYSKENKFGIFDIFGNVEEWCQNWYSENILAPDTQKLFKVLRGGSYQDKASTEILKKRNFIFPVYKKETYGFRIAMDKS